jgi:hypothetical protein
MNAPWVGVLTIWDVFNADKVTGFDTVGAPDDDMSTTADVRLVDGDPLRNLDCLLGQGEHIALG